MPNMSRRVVRKRVAKSRRSKPLGYTIKKALAALRSQNIAQPVAPGGAIDHERNMSQVSQDTDSPCRETQPRCRQCCLKDSTATVCDLDFG